MPWIVHTSRNAQSVVFALSCMRLLADPVVGMLAESEPDSGPGSSSYELKAITEDLEQPHPAADHRDPWGDDPGAVPFNGSGDGRVDPARSSFSTAAAPWETPWPSLAVSEAARAEPWYSRVLQVWGIVFLIWAAMIVARSLFLQFVPGKRTDEPLRRRLQRGVGLAPRPRRRRPLLAGRSGPLHPWTSASRSTQCE